MPEEFRYVIYCGVFDLQKIHSACMVDTRGSEEFGNARWLSILWACSFISASESFIEVNRKKADEA